MFGLHTTYWTKYVKHVTCHRNIYCLRMLVIVWHTCIVPRYNKCTIVNTPYNFLNEWWHGTLFDNKELSKCFVFFVLLPRYACCKMLCNIQQSITISKIIELKILCILCILYLLFKAQSENAIYKYCSYWKWFIVFNVKILFLFPNI